MKATKLPSGNYRCRVWDNKLKKQVSFTADTRKEAERLAAVYDFETKEVCSLTFEEAYEEHMASHMNIWKIRAVYFPDEVIKTDNPKLIEPVLNLPSEATILATAKAVEGTPACVPFYLAAYGAMRRGEVGGLQMDHIDLNARTIFIEYVLSDAGSDNWVRERPKTPSSIRKITVPQIVIDKIREYGLPNLTPDNIYDEFCKALTNAGIEHYRFHDLRHFCAARMLSKGIPIAVVQQYGGWKDEKTLMKIYNYVIDEVKKESMDLWNNYVLESYENTEK